MPKVGEPSLVSVVMPTPPRGRDRIHVVIEAKPSLGEDVLIFCWIICSP